MRVLGDAARTLRLWARLLLPWPLVASYVATGLAIGLLGATSLPLLTEVGDSRVVYFAAPLFTIFAGLASGATGPFWRSWDDRQDRAARSLWGMGLLVLGAAPTILLFRLHGVSVPVAVGFIGVDFLAVLGAAAAFGRVHAGYLPLGLTTMALFSAQSPLSAYAFGWLLEPDHARVQVIVGALCMLGGLVVYAVAGDIAE